MDFTRDDPNVMILAWYLWNQQCDMHEHSTNNIFFVFTQLWKVLCILKEWPEIYPETAMPSMHWRTY